MAKILIVDFETRSKIDLIKAGSYTYAQDTSTDILCCAFMWVDKDDKREWLWFAKDGPLPYEIQDEIVKADFVAAHNAGFDRLIWEFVAVNDYGFPKIPLEKWYCTSAQCRVNNLPASLENAARALDASQRKDFRGAALIRALSLPDKETGEFQEDAALLKEMGDYCLQDVRTTKAIVNATRLMTETEHDDWLINEEINDRGIKIDVAMAEAAQRYANDEYIEIAKQLSEDSGGVVTKHTQTVRAAKWVRDQVPEGHPIIAMMTKYVEGEVKYSLDKQTRGEILDAYDNCALEVSDTVINVVEALHDSSKSSVAKFKNMALRADPDNSRVYGAFVYAGASQTGRYSSRGLQIHNMPSRDTFKIDEATSVYKRMMDGSAIPEPVMDTLRKMLRYTLMPSPGHKFVIGDWSGIEARVLPWLSFSDGGDAKLDLIEDIDKALRAGKEPLDLYQLEAEKMGIPDRRDLGKVMTLACGYQGGLNAFKVFARAYGVSIPDHEAEVLIKRWREVNPWVVEFWRGLETAAMVAVAHPGTRTTAGMIDYLYSPELINGTLLCILPDESVIQYPACRIEKGPYGKKQLTALKASVQAKADASEWPRESLYGGRLAGNATQATAAVLLKDLLSRVSDVVAHVHDEIVSEVRDEDADKYAENLKTEMETPPEWAEGLPLRAEPEVTSRYKK